MIFVAAWKYVIENSLASASISLVYLACLWIAACSIDPRNPSDIKEDVENINRHRMLFTIRVAQHLRLEIGIESFLFFSPLETSRELDDGNRGP